MILGFYLRDSKNIPIFAPDKQTKSLTKRNSE
jgi:hypothetical protein